MVKNNGEGLPANITKIPVIGRRGPPCQICERALQEGEPMMGFPTPGGKAAAVHLVCFWESLRWANKNRLKTKHAKGKEKDG